MANQIGEGQWQAVKIIRSVVYAIKLTAVVKRKRSFL